MTAKRATKATSPKELKRQVSVNKNKADKLTIANDALADENESLRERLEAAENPKTEFQGFSMDGLSAPTGMEEVGSEDEGPEQDDLTGEAPAEIEIHAEDQQAFPQYSKAEIDQAISMLRATRTSPSDAKNNPVTSSGIVDTNDEQLPESRDRHISNTGDAKDAIDSAETFIHQDQHHSMTKMEELAFMEQVVTIVVADTDDEAQQPVPVAINDGIRQAFIRGIPLEVKRKFVEILGRCKKTGYTNVRYINEQGDESYKAVPHTTLMYPFQILQDPAGLKGMEWLKRILAEA